ncbi:hypothetical protein LOTGIDRAFT_137008 [Lottia gigantea]|uniref:Transmembrane protein 144 n=1 Tax=Lottia gigantea TaxID=225164 RepID=V4CMU1_LOTGI|nr:hypothetical protein LOTGIDRAFT_137008 [Lottia gigantea]ESP03690.1 hypothetical protein LOTGIDRAFT_137008 [Lottia gigantea]
MYTPTTNSTVLPDNSPVYPEYVGFICAGVAVIFYGSNFVPVKKYETGDGMFFQWILCSAILASGLVLQAIRPSTFYPICLLGGAIWATGNICVVPIIKTIGLGLGLCIWATTNLIAGWATGKFGLFDTKKAVLANTAMNYAGVVIAGSSAFIYIFVKSEVSAQSTELCNSTVSSSKLDFHPLGDKAPWVQSLPKERNILMQLPAAEDVTFIDTLSPKGKFITGVVLSLVSGLCYGNLFSPSLHVQYAIPGSSTDSLDYVFATFCGIYIASTVYFLIYCLIMKNKPRIYSEAILPGIVSGVMWSIATGFLNLKLEKDVIFKVTGLSADLDYN